MFCKTLFQLIHYCSDGSLLSAQRCFACRLLLKLFKRQYWSSSRVSVDYTCKFEADFFCVVLIDVSYKQCAALLCSCFLFCSSLSHESLQMFGRICSAKLCCKSFTIVLMEVSYKRTLLCFSLAPFILQVWILKLSERFGRLHLQM